MWVKRTGFVFILTVVVILSLLLRIAYISFGAMSERVEAVAGSRKAEITLYNSKGLIYDRNIIPLAGNQFSYYLVIDPRTFDRTKTGYVAALTGNEESYISEKLTSETMFVLKSFNEPETVEGVYVFEGTSRYPENAVSKHLLGYLDSENQVGLSGVEKAFNDELSEFSTSCSVSYASNAIRGLMNETDFYVNKESDDSQNGIVLTIDKKLAEFSESTMKKYISEGALVIMNPENGEIISMSSFPEFEPEKVYEYIGSDGGELLNNAMVNQTVGSVYKMVISACALINGLENFEFECSGAIEVGGKVFSCQNNKSHGKQNIYDAFSNSCNCYYIAIGQLLGYDRIIETSQLFGIDSSLQICKGLYSASGIYPDEKGIYSVANLSIGQGELMISPLQISRITAAVCNGGYLVNPTVYYGTYACGVISCKSEYKYKSQIFSSDIAEKLKNMCIKCVEEGTGINAKPSASSAGGKTASAQTGQYSADGKEILNTYFTGFYPADKPEYVITVFAKNGTSGSSTCAPVFKEICEFISENY